MNPFLAAAAPHGTTALWYLTRATGLVSLILLSATLVLGIVSSVGWTSERWPRFLSQTVHRNLSLFCVALVVVHVVTTVADGYVPIGIADAVIPFRSPYRPIWVGLGAFGFDLLLTVAVTSGLRRRIGVRAWRGVHWLAYACWPIALVHGLGSGSDTRLPGALTVDVLCVVAVVGAAGWRLAARRTIRPGRRVGAAASGAVVLLGITVFALTGPMQPGWARRAGTSTALLAQLGSGTGTTSSSGRAPGPAPTTAPAGSTGSAPATTFSSALSGTYSVSGPDGAGLLKVVISMRVQGDGLPLVVTLIGPAVDGGVSMTSSQVTFGVQQGVVTSLEGSTVAATVGGSGVSENLTMQLALDRATGAVTGTVSGTAAGRSGEGSGR